MRVVVFLLENDHFLYNHNHTSKHLCTNRYFNVWLIVNFFLCPYAARIYSMYIICCVFNSCMEGVLLIRKEAPAISPYRGYGLVLTDFGSHRCHHLKCYSVIHIDEQLELNAAGRLISVMKVYGYFQVQYIS